LVLDFGPPWEQNRVAIEIQNSGWWTMSRRMDGTRRNVTLLATCQGFLITNVTIFMLVGALVGRSLLDAKELATLPMTAFWLGGALATIPASMLMKQIGRRHGFMVGALFGVAGGVVCTYGVYASSFWILCLGGGLMGCYYAFGQYYRFAAVEAAEEVFRSRAISLVVAGGVAGAVLGPETARWTSALFETDSFIGSFAALSAFSMLTFVVVSFVRLPVAERQQESVETRPLARIAVQPAFIVAALAGVLGFAGMQLIMVATPLAMTTNGLPFGSATSVIEWHVAGMFAPGFVAGALIARFGVLNIILWGALLTCAGVAFAVTGIDFWNFWWAVFLNGVGWSLLFIGGTSLLTECCAPAEQAKVQGFNDFLILVALTSASLSAGLVLELLSWNAVAFAILPMAALIGAATLGLIAYRRHEHRQAI
jgi:MFS family permease